ncbi:hypothetical protein CCP3SC1AL1_630016 [Gammaproteobacteria bacterium]
MNVLVDLFDKTLQEFIVEYNHSFKSAASYVIKDGINEVLLFEKQISKNLKLYEDQDDTLFPKVLIFYRIGLHTKKFNKKNKENTWEYVKNLYLISNKLKLTNANADAKLSASEQQQQLEHIASKSFKEDDTNVDIDGVLKMTSSLFGSDNPDLNDLLSSVTSKVTEKLKGKDLNSLNIMELMNSLQNPGSSGNPSCSALDSLGLSGLIAEITEETKQKVEDGTLDVEKLRKSVQDLSKNEQLSSLSGSIPGLDLSKLQESFKNTK